MAIHTGYICLIIVPAILVKEPSSILAPKTLTSNIRYAYEIVLLHLCFVKMKRLIKSVGACLEES